MSRLSKVLLIVFVVLAFLGLSAALLLSLATFGGTMEGGVVSAVGV